MPVRAEAEHGSSTAPCRSWRHSMQIRWFDPGWPEVRLCRGARVGSLPRVGGSHQLTLTHCETRIHNDFVRYRMLILACKQLTCLMMLDWGVASVGSHAFPTVWAHAVRWHVGSCWCTVLVAHWACQRHVASLGNPWHPAVLLYACEGGLESLGAVRPACRKGSHGAGTHALPGELGLQYIGFICHQPVLTQRVAR